MLDFHCFTWTKINVSAVFFLPLLMPWVIACNQFFKLGKGQSVLWFYKEIKLVESCFAFGAPIKEWFYSPLNTRSSSGVRKQGIDEEKETQEVGLPQFCCAQNSLLFMCSLADGLSRHSFHPQWDDCDTYVFEELIRTTITEKYLFLCPFRNWMTTAASRPCPLPSSPPNHPENTMFSRKYNLKWRKSHHSTSQSKRTI